jgi:hypothetical protein
MFSKPNNSSATGLRPALITPLLCALLTACGGGDYADNADASPTARLLRGGGGGATAPATQPSSAPAPGILVRESFGFGDGFRPAGGKGVLRAVPLHTTLGGFWSEYPASKNSAWLTPDGNQTWKFAGIGGYLDPYELPSPLQSSDFNQGAMVSEWFDAVTQYPTALLPFTPPAKPYAVSMEGYPSVVGGAYVAIGLTASPATLSNFSTVGQVWLGLRKQQAMVNGDLVYEWRLDGSTGALLATGVVEDLTWNRMELRVDPVTKSVSASINGVVLGTQPFASVPKYAGFEGVGVLDNFVIRLAP